MNGGAHALEKLEPLDDTELAGLAIVVNRLALDVLHHEVRQAVLGGAAIEQPRNVGMVQAGQYLPLVAEALDDELGVEVAPDELDGDLLTESLVGAGGQVNHTHTTLADFPDHSVGPDAPPSARV